MHLLSEPAEICQDLMDPWRKKAWDRLQILGNPHRKNEAFQYVRFGSLALPPRKEAHDVRLTNLPSSVICISLSDALKTYGIFLQSRFTNALKEETDPFATLNGAVHARALFLYIPPFVKIEETVAIEHFFSLASAAYPRIHIFLGKEAKLNLSQKILAPHLDLFCNSYIDISLDEGAHLNFSREGHFSSKTAYFESFRVSLKKKSFFTSTSREQGGALFRSSWKINLLEEESEALLQGISELQGEEQHHRHVTMHHKAPSCKSHQYFKGVLKDKSISSFEGKIIVDSIAQKTESYQLSKNLVLSDDASVFTKPNLEISADDVKASHGATIARLSQEELLYLRSRGIALKDAEHLLIQAFTKFL